MQTGPAGARDARVPARLRPGCFQSNVTSPTIFARPQSSTSGRQAIGRSEAGTTMDFSLTAEQEAIRDAVGKVCARFGDDYWLAKDRDGGFPDDFHRAFADDGWLGVCIPQEYGGAGLGVTEAALMMQTIAESGAGMSGASALHMNIFGLNPVVVFGSDEQKKRMLPPLIAGKDKACFAVTEPNVGLDTLKLKTKAMLRRRALRSFGPEDLDFDRAGRKQDAHPRAHDAARTGRAPHRWPEPVLHRPRPALRRCPRNPEDGPQRRRLQRAVHRRAAGAGRRPHRRGGQGLSNTSCTA